MATPFPFQANAVLTAAELNAITTLPINDQTASYVLVAGDVGKRVVMDVAGANTVTVNTGTFGTGDMVFIMNKGAGTSTITAGAGVTINTTGSLALSQYGGGTLLALSATVFNFFPSGGIGYGTATGGSSSSITVGGQNYTLLEFTSSSTLTVTKAGLFDVLVCAGGGGGGGNGAPNSNSTGGGGAGGILQSTIYLDANATVTIGGGGAGGVGGASISLPGSSSSIGGARGVSVAGGGRGFGNYVGGVGQYGSTSVMGGSGGGGLNSNEAPRRTGAASMAPGVSGEAGGDGANSNTAGQGGGGGGGATAVGGNASGTTGGAGGAGYDVSAFIGGSALFKCGGGGGGGTTGGAGGSSVGGAGGSNANGTAAGANTASGGGGNGNTGANTRSGGNGGSGIIYVRFEV
jgi:hypothetical protein